MEGKKLAKLFFNKDKDRKLLEYIAKNHTLISKHIIVHTTPTTEGTLPRLIINGQMIAGDQVLMFFNKVAHPPPPKPKIEGMADLNNWQHNFLKDDGNWKEDRGEVDFTGQMHAYIEDVKQTKGKRKPDGFALPVSDMSGDQKDNLMISQRQSDNVSYPDDMGGDAMDRLNDHFMNVFHSSGND
jgi:hypothetical protein